MAGRGRVGSLDGKHVGRAQGTSIPELTVVLALITTVAAASVPPLLRVLDGARVRAGARYLAARLQFARMLAVKRSQYVAIYFEPVGRSYRIAFYADGNGNGVRTVEIAGGVDPPLGPSERLEDQVATARLGFADEVPAVDGRGILGPGDSPVRVGRSPLLSFSPLGTSSSGTLYVCGRGLEQYAVRVLGPTGRVRVLRLNRLTRQWEAQ